MSGASGTPPPKTSATPPSSSASSTWRSPPPAPAARQAWNGSPRCPLPGHNPALPQALHRADDESRRRVLGEDLRRPHGRRRHARPPAAPQRRLQHRRRKLPDAHPPSPRRETHKGGAPGLQDIGSTSPHPGDQLGNSDDRDWGSSKIGGTVTSEVSGLWLLAFATSGLQGPEPSCAGPDTREAREDLAT
jgi:hypothetical protein